MKFSIELEKAGLIFVLAIILAMLAAGCFMLYRETEIRMLLAQQAKSEVYGESVSKLLRGKK